MADLVIDDLLDDADFDSSVLEIVDPQEDVEESPPSFFDLSTKKVGCIPEAHKLRKINGNKGDVYMVDKLEGRSIIHAYYVPEGAKPEDTALNQKDNGFEGFPALTVAQVLSVGIPMNTFKQAQDYLLTPQ